MFEFWLDADSLIRPYREAYRFDTVPKFWKYLEQKAKEQTTVSSQRILRDIERGSQVKNKPPDELVTWARQLDGILFLAPEDDVQQVYKQIVENVSHNGRYAPYWIHEFLSGSDPWIIAHAKAHNGRVVTFEKSEPNSRKVKIPDVAAEFDVKCLCLWDMLSELKANLS